MGESESACDADDWRKCEHETNHDTGKVACKDGIDNNEYMLIFEIAEAHVHSGWEQPDEEIQIEEEGRPGSWLMFGDGRNDRNMDLSISGIPQRVESTAPRCDRA